MENTSPRAKSDLSLLAPVLAEYGPQKGSLITVLQHAQDIYGYLPIEVQTMIADGMNIPLEKVYGVSTFYSQFALNPKLLIITVLISAGSGRIITAADYDLPELF